MRRMIAAWMLIFLLLPTGAAVHAEATLPLDADPKLRLPQDERVYFIFVDRFANGDPANDGDADRSNPRTWHGGDLQGVIDKLDYIKNLGFTAIWLTPIVKNAGHDYHGYGAVDFFAVDPHFGDMALAKKLVDEAHRREMKVIFDLVVNHTGPGHPLVQEKPDWFNPERPCRNWNDQQEIETCWIFDLPDFNQNNPEVREYILKYSLFWIEETGVDGFRLDTAKHVPVDFWRWYTGEIKKRHPHFWLLGEVWHNSPDYLAQYQDAGLDAITDFPFQEAATKVYAKLQHTRALRDATLSSLSQLPDPTNMGAFIDNHDMMRFATAAYGDVERLKLALVHLFTHTSIPIFYYGTEIALTGGNDPHNRPDFPWETLGQGEPDVYKLIKALNTIRHEHIALRRGGWEELLTERWQFAFARHAGRDRVVVVLNAAEEERFTADLPLPGYLPDGTLLFDKLSGKQVRVADGKMAIDLAPKTAAIFTVRETRAGTYFAVAFVATAVLIGGTLLVGRRRAAKSS